MSLSYHGRRSVRRNAPLLLLLLALPLSLLTHCSGSSPDLAPTTTQCVAASDCGIHQTTCEGSSVASFVARCPSGACVWDKTTTACSSSCSDGACRVEGSTPQTCKSATDCELPRSTCNAAGSLVYYTNASCNSGVCSWQEATMFCGGGCSNGGCQFSTTTASGPPIGGFGGGGQSGATGGGGAATSGAGGISGGAGGAGGASGETSGGAGAGG